MSSVKKDQETMKIERILLELEHGCELMKVKNSKKQYERFFFVDREKRQLIYDGSQKPFGPPLISVKLNQIKDIRDGTRETNKMFDKIDKSRMFCVVVGNNHKLLRLLAHSEKIKNKWVAGLTYLVQEHMFASQQKAHDQWIMDSFRLADRNESGGVEFDELLPLLKSMNADIDKSYVKKLFNEANTTKTKGRQNLDRKEFVTFFKLLTKRPEIQMLFDWYSQKKTYIDSISLIEFLTKEQKMKNAENKVEHLIKLFEPDAGFKAEKKISIDGFRNLLLSNGQRLFDPKFKVIYQDMHQPLNHYYINSSHNTYLMEDQLKGPSSTEAYIRALQMGCRCVELDCWDGPDGEPIIYHGHTLTSKINFTDVINVINQYAFDKSPLSRADDRDCNRYPVILSIENHCSVDQQTFMAKYMMKVFGDLLYKQEVKGDSLPSPDMLQNKILIKAKKLKEAHDDGVSDEDESAERDGSKSQKKVKLSKALSDLVVCCKSVHFQGFQRAKSGGDSTEMSSLGEKKTDGLLKENGEGFVEHTQHQLVRVYPAGTRTDSSNYDPVPAWCVGAQIVALNFQTHSSEMWINQSRFLDNGGCGYVLKPVLLRTPGNKFDPCGPQNLALKKQLTIKIISAFQLPKPEFNTKGEIIDPYVKIEVMGIPEDCKEVQTCVVQNNGFTPQWNESFEFDLHCPDLAMVLFTVYDHDIAKHDFIGYHALPFHCMQLGFRQFYLADKFGHQRGRSVIFAHISVTEPQQTSTPVSRRRLPEHLPITHPATVADDTRHGSGGEKVENDSNGKMEFDVNYEEKVDRHVDENERSDSKVDAHSGRDVHSDLEEERQDCAFKHQVVDVNDNLNKDAEVLAESNTTDICENEDHQKKELKKEVNLKEVEEDSHDCMNADVNDDLNIDPQLHCGESKDEVKDDLRDDAEVNPNVSQEDNVELAKTDDPKHTHKNTSNEYNKESGSTNDKQPQQPPVNETENTDNKVTFKKDHENTQ